MTLNTQQSKEISEVLRNFGLLESEQRAYLTLLQLGRSTASPISQKLNIPLTTAQSLLLRLSGKGLITTSKKKTRAVYEANDPAVLKKLLQQQLQEITGVIPLLQSMQKESGGKSKVAVYSAENINDIFLQALSCKGKVISEIVSAKDMQILLGEKFHFTRRRLEKSIHLKSLRVEAHEIKKYNQAAHQKELREARFLPREFTFKGNIMFWDSSVAIFSPANENLSILVQSEGITLMFQQLFEMLWSVSRKMETLT